MVRSALGEANFRRLAEIKGRYDQSNFFRVNLNMEKKEVAELQSA